MKIGRVRKFGLEMIFFLLNRLGGEFFLLFCTFGGELFSFYTPPVLICCHFVGEFFSFFPASRVIFFFKLPNAPPGYRMVRP